MKICSGIDTKGKLAALTFDDGPNPVFTPLILDTLRNMNVKATFFLLGKRVEQFPNIALKVRDEGHCIGSHTYYHDERLQEQGIDRKTDFNKGITAIEGLLKIKCQFFKPPSNNIDPYRDFLAADTRAIVCQSTNCVETRDYGYQELSDPTPTMKEIISKVTGIRTGQMIELHDGSQHDDERCWPYRATPTYLVLPEIIKELKKDGCRFVKLDEM